jgi:carbohydrate diacid regulator
LKLFQNLVEQIANIIDNEFGITDESGLILGCTNESRVGEVHPSVLKCVEKTDTFYTADGITFQKVYIKNKLELIIFINSEDGQSRKYLSLIAVNAANIKNYFEEKFDKNNFFKNLILDSFLPGDAAARAKELHIASDALRSVFLIKTEKVKDIHSREITQSLFPNRGRDFAIALDDDITVLIKELKSGENDREIDRTARSIVDTLNTELMVKAQIGIGSVADNIKDVARSFREAQTALQIGSIFEREKSIIKYNSLGIGRLIYQLPPSICRLFLEEVFSNNSLNALDAETLVTIQKFFENNLNVSETSRQLYIHRNTLVYRLDKIQKLTGLDLRNFDNAIIFKVAMLVKRNLDKAGKTN